MNKKSVFKTVNYHFFGQKECIFFPHTDKIKKRKILFYTKYGRLRVRYDIIITDEHQPVHSHGDS